jgi:hypothetical protein
VSIERGKLLEQVCARLPSTVIEELRIYMRERERLTEAPFTLSLVVREILVRWADDRRVKRQGSAQARARG